MTAEDFHTAWMFGAAAFDELDGSSKAVLCAFWFRATAEQREVFFQGFRAAVASESEAKLGVAVADKDIPF